MLGHRRALRGSGCLKRTYVLGWLLAGLLALQSAATGLAAPASNPLEARLLQHSGGAVFLYHNGVKFLVEPADVGDAVIDAIPTASAEEWNALFATTNHNDATGGVPQRAPAGQWYPSPPDQPQRFPGYS